MKTSAFAERDRCELRDWLYSLNEAVLRIDNAPGTFSTQKGPRVHNARLLELPKRRVAGARDLFNAEPRWSLEPGTSRASKPTCRRNMGFGSPDGSRAFFGERRGGCGTLNIWRVFWRGGRDSSPSANPQLRKLAVGRKDSVINPTNHPPLNPKRATSSPMPARSQRPQCV